MPVRITFTGDVMCEHTRLNDYIDVNGQYDFNPVFSGCYTLFEHSDYTVSNLETPIAGEELRYSWRNYQFNTPEQILDAMHANGIDMVTTANNHALDRGKEGLDRTIQHIKKANLEFTGTAVSEETSKPLIKNLDGIKVAFLAYTYGTEACYNKYYLRNNERYKVNLLRNQELTNPIKRYLLVSKSLPAKIFRLVYRAVAPNLAKRPIESYRESDRVQKNRLMEDISYCKRSQADIIIMCLHCGGQFNDQPTPYTEEIVEYCLSNGVDLVVCNHEHLIQKANLSKDDKKVAFCLGNFSSNYGIHRKPYDKEAQCSVVLHLDISKLNGKLQMEFAVSIVISQEDADGKIVTVPLATAYEQSETEERREALLLLNTRCVNRLFDANFSMVTPQQIYQYDEVYRCVREGVECI